VFAAAGAGGRDYKDAQICRASATEYCAPARRPSAALRPGMQSRGVSAATKATQLVGDERAQPTYKLSAVELSLCPSAP